MTTLEEGEFKLAIDGCIKHPINDKVGYICEVDLEYPDELHQVHNDYPLAPEKLEVKSEWLSQCQQKFLLRSPSKSALKVKK